MKVEDWGSVVKTVDVSTTVAVAVTTGTGPWQSAFFDRSVTNVEDSGSVVQGTVVACGRAAATGDAVAVAISDADATGDVDEGAAGTACGTWIEGCGCFWFARSVVIEVGSVVQMDPDGEYTGVDECGSRTGVAYAMTGAGDDNSWNVCDEGVDSDKGSDCRSVPPY